MPDLVDIWLADLDVPVAELAGLGASLDETELNEARRMASALDGRRYIARKAFERSVLADYLAVSPRAIEIVADGFGKPRLGAGFESSGLRFNFSHSGRIAVAAAASEISVGVDVERVRPVQNRDDIAAWFCDGDFAQQNERDEVRDDYGFLVKWTQLEARAKCSGQGLSRHSDCRSRSEWLFHTLEIRHAGERYLITIATLDSRNFSPAPRIGRCSWISLPASRHRQ